MRGTIYYVGDFKFPEGQAASFRVLGNTQALRAGGFPTVIVGRGGQASGVGSVNPQTDSEEALPYHLVDEYGPRSAPLWRQVWRYLLGGQRLACWLNKNAAADAKALVLYGGYTRYLLRLMPLANRLGIPLITDLVEWYEPSQCVGGRFGPQRWDVELTNRTLAPLAGNSIVISSFLEDFFTRRGMKTVRVPPLIDASDAKWAFHKNGHHSSKLCLGFVGNAGKKDLLVNAVRGLALLGEKARECEVRIVGPSKEELRTNLVKDSGLLEVLEENLHFVGRLTHRDALHNLEQADFSILLRPDLRFAHAGFPTKLVESLAMGVPVICNLTSDIGMYVRDGQEGLVVEDSSPEAFASGVRRALALSREQRMTMRENARQRAVVSFDYRNWVAPIGEFMTRVIENRQQRSQWQLTS